MKINGEIRTTKNNWTIRCFDCANPPCIMKPQCKTCPTCRNPSCNNKKCKQPIESLAFKLRPKSLTDVQDFICQGCAIIRCDICDLEKPKDSFSKSAIYDTKKKKNRRCIDCSNPPCVQPGCKTCTRCRDHRCNTKACKKAIQTLNSNILPVNLHDVKHFACQGCLLMTCVLCKLQKTSDEFSHSQLIHKSRSGHIKCLACSNPPCIFRPKCQTCKTCRNPSCRVVRNCKKEVVKVKIEPATMEEVVNYTCERCLYLRCTTIESDGTRCGRLRRLNKHNDAKKKKVDYQCGECATLIFSQKNRFFPKKDGI